MLNSNEKIKFGFVTIVGKPNSGKSTLLNKIIGHKLSIVTYKKNTTRNQIRGIYNDQDSQIVFMDTPGFIKSKSSLDADMHQRILDSIKEVDIILYLIPFWKKLDNEYLKTINLTKNNTNIKKYLLLTKIDKSNTKQEIYESANQYKDTDTFDKIMPISSFKNLNIDNLISEIKSDLKLDFNHYDRDRSFEVDDKFYVAEIIREKALFNLNNEIPHNLFVKIDYFKEKKDLIFVRAEIIVNRENLKNIIIGKQGSKVKIIGQKAREELENYFSKKIFLEIFVKVRKNWQNKDSIIKEI